MLLSFLSVFSSVNSVSFRTEDSLALTVFAADYMSKLVDYCMMKFYTLIKVQETNQVWSEEDDFVLEKPRLKVEVRRIKNNII